MASIYLHIVFSTRERQPFLRNSQLRSEAHAYLAGTCHNLGFRPIQIGGVEDHVHLLVSQSRVSTIANTVKELKIASHKVLQAKGIRDFAWQEGYGVFSCSHREIPMLDSYIQNQEEHHSKESSLDELRRILLEAGIEPDEKYFS